MIRLHSIPTRVPRRRESTVTRFASGAACRDFQHGYCFPPVNSAERAPGIGEFKSPAGSSPPCFSGFHGYLLRGINRTLKRTGDRFLRDRWMIVKMIDWYTSRISSRFSRHLPRPFLVFYYHSYYPSFIATSKGGELGSDTRPPEGNKGGVTNDPANESVALAWMHSERVDFRGKRPRRLIFHPSLSPVAALDSRRKYRSDQIFALQAFRRVTKTGCTCRRKLHYFSSSPSSEEIIERGWSRTGDRFHLGPAGPVETEVILSGDARLDDDDGSARNRPRPANIFILFPIFTGFCRAGFNRRFSNGAAVGSAGIYSRGNNGPAFPATPSRTKASDGGNYLTTDASR